MQLRTTIVGLYPKISEDPDAVNLRRERNRFDRGQIGAEELEQAYQATIRRVVREQEEAGLDVLSHGQVRWDDLCAPFAASFAGVEVGGLRRFFDNNVYYRRPVVTGEVAWQQPVTVADFELAKSATSKPLKASLPGPFTLACLSKDEHYGDLGQLTLAYARALHQEATALDQLGPALIEIEEPSLGFHPGADDLFVDALRIVTQGVKAPTSVYSYFGALNGVAHRLTSLPVSCVGFDVVTRSENLKVLNQLSGWVKQLAVGCLDARNTRLESEHKLLELFVLLEEHFPNAVVYVSPNASLEFLPHSRAVEKMKLLAAAARKYPGV